MLNIFLFALNCVLIVTIFFLFKSINRYKETFRQRSLFKVWPVKKVSIEQFDQRFKSIKLGPSKETEVLFIGGWGSQGSASDFETWILCVFAKQANHIFEFGTFTGKTTYLLAKNALPTSKCFTITLSPAEVSTYKPYDGDDAKDTKAAIQESIYDSFYYTDDPIKSKIIQLFGDSKDFDETPYLNQMDMIFIDGSHAHSYVENDSQKALRMIKPGGVIFWHDYRGPNRAVGVFDTLNTLSAKIPLVHIDGTSLVAYRKES